MSTVLVVGTSENSKIVVESNTN